MSAPRILIVEDEGIIAIDIEEALQSLNYRVAGRATTGSEAIRMASETKPELVLMDINLGGEMDGIEAAARIHSGNDIPVVFLTAHADKNTLQRAKVVEPYGYVLKPFRQTELRTAIELALHQHSVDKARNEKVTAGTPVPAPTAPIPDFQSELQISQLPSASMQVTIRSFFESVAPLSELGPDVINAISAVCYVKSYKNYDALVHEGGEPKSGFLVMAGRVAVFKTSPGGKELIVELLGNADLFGLLSVLERAPYPFSARAQGDTTVLWVPREVVFYITDNYPEIGRDLFGHVLRRLRKAHDHSRALAHDRVEIRLASALIAITDTFAEQSNDGKALEVEMTRQELGELAGTTPETVSRVLNRMESDGIVDLSVAGRVRVIEQTALRGMLNSI